MADNNISPTARNIAWMMELLLLGLGLTTLILPQIMERYGLSINSVHSVMSIRALWGC